MSSNASQFSVTKTFEFAAAHFLTKYHGKCENLHGHNYKLVVTVTGEPGPEDMVIDFAELSRAVKEHVIAKLDHTNLNDHFPNPSCERVAEWIFNTLKPHVPVNQVELWETPTSSVIYKEV